MITLVSEMEKDFSVSTGGIFLDLDANFGEERVSDIARGYLEKLAYPPEEGMIVFAPEEEEAANCALEEITQLYRQGKYPPEKFRQLVDLVIAIISQVESLDQRLYYYPGNFGLRGFWEAALSDSAEGGRVRSATIETLKRISENPPSSPLLFSFITPIFEAFNQLGDLTEEEISILATFFISTHMATYDRLSPEVFHTVVKKKIEQNEGVYYWPGHIKSLFSKRGVALKLAELADEMPERFDIITRALFPGIDFVPEDEFPLIKATYQKAFKRSGRKPLELETCLTFLQMWHQGFRGPSPRMREWSQFILPELAFYLEINGKIENPNKILQTIIEINQRERWDCPLLAPIAERLLTKAAGITEIPFIGNLATALESDAYLEARAKEPDSQTQALFSRLRGFLHMSLLEEARVLLQEIIRDPKAQEFLQKNPERRAKFSLICHQLLEEKDSLLRYSLQLARAALAKLPSRDQEVDEILTITEELGELTPDASLRSLNELMKKILKLKTNNRAPIYPIIIAIRRFILDQGIDWLTEKAREENIDQVEFLLTLGVLTYEIPPAVRFAYQRLQKVQNRRVYSQLRNNIIREYQQLNDVYEIWGHHPEREIIDLHRQFTSRSLLDFIFRILSSEGN